MNAQDRSDVEELAAALPPCSQCGKRFTERACGISHAIIAADPLRHRLIAPLVERDLAERDARVAREALLDAADDLARLVDGQHPDALNPDQWLRDRADEPKEGDHG